MAMIAEYRSEFEAPSVMVTSPCEWKFLEWNTKPQTNKHTMDIQIGIHHEDWPTQIKWW